MRGLPILVLFSFLVSTTVVTADGTAEAVIDSSGEKVEAGGSYYILPFLKGQGGGLTFGPFGKNPKSCKDIVIFQDPVKTSNGEAVRFTPSNPKNHVVYTSRPLNINFTHPKTTCEGETGMWTNSSPLISRADNIGTHGVLEKDPPFTLYNNFFAIMKATEYDTKGVYKLSYCPTTQADKCNNYDGVQLGTFTWKDLNKRFLGIASYPGFCQPFPVIFTKATTSNYDGHNNNIYTYVD